MRRIDSLWLLQFETTKKACFEYESDESDESEVGIWGLELCSLVFHFFFHLCFY
jgi:hypothetical protein